MGKKIGPSLSNAELVRRYEKLGAKASRLGNRLIKAGYGSLKPSEMRALIDKVPFLAEYLPIYEYLKNSDERCELRIEAENRYGPGLLNVSQLKGRK